MQPKPTKKTEHTNHDLGAPDLKRANAREQSHKQLSRNRYEHPLRQRFVAHGQRRVRGRSSYPTGTTPGNSENIAHVRKGFERVFFFRNRSTYLRQKCQLNFSCAKADIIGGKQKKTPRSGKNRQTCRNDPFQAWVCTRA